MKYNLSKIMKRAWELVKKVGMTISCGLKEAWREAKSMEENIVDVLKKNLEDMAYTCKYIHFGIDRIVVANEWKKNGHERTYLNINCYSLAGNYKGQYKCGYVDMITGEYVVGRYDDVDALNKEYIGR